MRRLLFLGLALAALSSAWAQVPQIRYPDATAGSPLPVSRSGAAAKMSADLQSLAAVFGSSRSASSPEARSYLAATFGFDPSARDPRVSVRVESSSPVSRQTIASMGAVVVSEQSDALVVGISVSQLSRLAAVTGVERLDALKARGVEIVRPRGSSRGVSRGPVMTSGLTWDNQGLTGKGVQVVVLDTGIDFRHPDFMNPDKTTRLAYIYDMGDDSFRTSGGKVGSAPPLKDSSGQPLGTLYTRAQINAALKGTGTVNTKDYVGHGTACLSTAGGNGADPATRGPAYEAELGFIKVKVPRMIGGKKAIGLDGKPIEEFSELYPLAAQWAAGEAKKAGKSVVMNFSFGTAATARTGQESDELILDKLTGKDNPGVILTISAGNDGRDATNARGTFGPRRAGQQDIDAEPIEVFATDEDVSVFDVYLKKSDEWGFYVIPRAPVFEDAGKPLDMHFAIEKKGTTLTIKAIPRGGAKIPQAVMEELKQSLQYSSISSAEERIRVFLPYGSYYVFGYGATDKVVSGEYTISGLGGISVGMGGSREQMVGSPGNATNAITVGSFVSRNEWTNMAGGTTFFSFRLGEISSFSSPGPRRDGVVKPDIAGPGQYMLSALAKDSEMGLDSKGKLDAANVLQDGSRLSWQGTSASSPYTAGVIALMLQKNPKLTSDDVRRILRESATVDAQTRGVPNPQWGYGKLNPAAAIKATPAGKP